MKRICIGLLACNTYCFFYQLSQPSLISVRELGKSVAPRKNILDVDIPETAPIVQHQDRSDNSPSINKQKLQEQIIGRQDLLPTIAGLNYFGVPFSEELRSKFSKAIEDSFIFLQSEEMKCMEVVSASDGDYISIRFSPDRCQLFLERLQQLVTPVFGEDATEKYIDLVRRNRDFSGALEYQVSYITEPVRQLVVQRKYADDIGDAHSISQFYDVLPDNSLERQGMVRWGQIMQHAVKITHENSDRN